MQGRKSTPELLETFALRLADTIVQGDLSIGNWSVDKGADINVTAMLTL